MRRNAVRDRSDAERDLDRAQHLAGRERGLPHAGHEVGRRASRRSPPSARPDHGRRRRARPASEVIGPAGSAMAMLPPTVATFQILNEASSESAHCRTSGCAAQSASARQPRQLGDRAGRGDATRPSAVRRRSTGPAERGQVDEAGQAGLRLGEQPGAAAERALAGPEDEVGPARRGADLANGDQVHAEPPLSRPGFRACVGALGVERRRAIPGLRSEPGWRGSASRCPRLGAPSLGCAS